VRRYDQTRVDKGFYRLARPFTVALLVHWSLPLGALVASGLELAPVVWLGFFVVVLVHDAGHALLAKWLGQRVLAWELTAVGGACRYRGNASARARALIAWGGIGAQLALALATWLLTGAFGPLEAEYAIELSHTFIEINLWVAALNLLPVPPLDGAFAWKLFANLSGLRRSSERRVLFGLQRWLDARREARARLAGQPMQFRPRPSAARGKGESVAPASADFDDDALPDQPSEQAQAELSALLERVAREAASKAPRKN
jgi:Zn-dependent protease